MAIYAIGDLQGCYDPLRRLLDEINFDPSDDQIWFTGDLVNRGPKSLETLRLVKSMGTQAVTVLGNHDLHLVSAHLLGTPRKHKGDTIDPILAASDCDELIDWLLHQPLVHYDEQIKTLMVHAGIPPQWTLKKSLREARKVESQLQGKNAKKLLKKMYHRSPQKWSGKLSKWQRRQFTLMALTRMRYVRANGKLELSQKGGLDSHQLILYPWYEAPHRRWPDDIRIVFGHWSTLWQTGAYDQPRETAEQAICLDGGCVWGGQLIAARLTNSPEIQYTKINCEP